MTLVQWRKQKEDDRRAGDRQFHADPANARRYLAEWGLRPGDGIVWAESLPFSSAQPPNPPVGHVGKRAPVSRR